MPIAPFDVAPGAVPSAAPSATPGVVPSAAHDAAPPASPNVVSSATPSAAPNFAKPDHVVPLFSSIPSPLPTVIPLPLSSTSNPTLKRSTRPHKPPSYLSQYACKSVSTKPQSGLPYDVSAYLDYSHLGPSFKSFVMAVNSTPSVPASFHQAMQYPE